jgi:hypothetical protein
LNKIKICGICIPICLVFVSLLINASHGQSPVNFLNYANNDMKFTIQHPSNWQVKENTESPDGRVSFELSDRSLPIFAVNTEEVERHLDSDTMTVKNISLQQLA